MLIAAAVCPHPPLLVPEAAGAVAAELDEVRAACDAAVAVLAAARPELIVVVGGAARAAEFDASSAGGLAGYGIGWRTGAGAPVLPLSLTIGRWLLTRAGLLAAPAVTPPPGEFAAAAPPGESPALPVRLIATAFGAPTTACLQLGAGIAGRAGRVALLAMGDGSARLSAQAPGYLDPRAQPYDADVAAALAGADVMRLARLDPDLSADLLAAGRAAWQVLAGAAGDGAYHGRLHCAAAPYGVSYLVTSWTAAAAAA